MVVKNQLQRFNHISPSRKEFNVVWFGKSLYFRQTSSSVRTTKLRLGSKFKSWIQKIISYFFTRKARRKDKMKIKFFRIKKTKGNKKILHEMMMNLNEIINSASTDNSKETQTELSVDIEKENQELKTLN